MLPLRTLALLLVLASPLPAADIEVDANLVPGDSFAGVIDDASDGDAVRIEGLAAQWVRFTVVPGKGSALVPHLALLDAVTLEDVALAEPWGKGEELVAVLPETRAYLLQVTGAGGSTGSFVLKSKGKLPKEALNPPSEPGGAPGDLEVFVDALAGSLLNATIAPVKGSGGQAGIVALSGPSGPLDLDAYRVEKGDKVLLQNVPLAEFGEYILLAKNTGDPDGDLTVTTKIKPPKAKKHALIEARFAIVPDASVPAHGTCSANKLKLAGTLLDLSGDGLPGAVDWSVQGATKSKAGAFKVKNGAFKGSLPLEDGDNRIVLSANGGQAALVIECTCNLGFTFGGALVVTPDAAFVNESALFTAQVAILDKDVAPADVWLTWFDPLSGEDVELFPMTDDGDLGHGDEIQGDRVYTGRNSLAWLEAATVQLRVRAGRTDNGGSAWSERFGVLVSQHLSDGELNAMLAEQAAWQAAIDAAAAGGFLPDELAAIKAELDADPDIAQAGYSDGGQGLWMVYENGIPAVLYSPAADGKGSGGSAVAQPAPRPVPERAARAGAWDAAPKPDLPRYDAWRLPSGEQDFDLPAGVLAAKPSNTVKSNRARVIAAQYFDWGDDDDIPAMAQMLEDNGCFDVDYTRYFAKGAGSIEDFKGLGEYGLVLISSHGDSFYRGLLNLWADKFGWNGPLGIVVLHSNMQVTTANKALYENDLKKGRLVLWYGNYGLTPNFITRYTGAMPNSLVYMSICRGTWNGTLAQAFLSQGAGSYLGYSDYVAVSFCKAHGPPLLQTLLEPEKTMADAFTPGQKETDASPAEFMLYGAGDLALDPARLNDGGFESGSIGQSWLPWGDARIIPYLGEFSPQEGALMGIISTGLGFTTSSGSVSQTFCLGADAKAVAFDWNFISEEFVEYCGSIYQDYFTVSIEDLDAGGSTQLFSTWVDALCGDVFPVGFSFDQGDAHATGWRKANLALPAGYGGHKVRLTFAASDVGDSIYDTAILIDDIRVVE